MHDGPVGRHVDHGPLVFGGGRQDLLSAAANEWEAVFTSPKGRLRDPSNTQADLKATFERIGFEHITSHAFRRTVATLMDAAGLSARAAADQLGHAEVSMTTDHYFGRRIAVTGAARVLEAVVESAPGYASSEDESHG